VPVDCRWPSKQPCLGCDCFDRRKFGREIEMGETLTSATIWLAMLAWTVALPFRGRESVRWLWLSGFVFYLCHMGLAFHHYHDWSQSAAWEATARDTEELTGWRSGVGLLVNYAFAVWLAIELVFQFRNGKPVSLALEGFIFFMIVNGAILFGEGPVRWFGLVLSARILVSWIQRFRLRSPGS